MPKSYRVLVPINHNQQDYLPPATIELDDEYAEALLKVNAIGEVVEAGSAVSAAAETAPAAPVAEAPDEEADAAAPAAKAKK